MDNLCCGNCKKELTKDMEIEYSEWINEYFCCPDCATNRYFEYMRSSTFDLTDEQLLKEHNIKIVNGKLFKVE